MKFYYIHGLGSSKNSKKFLQLKEHYPNMECFDWTIDDNIDEKIKQWKNIILEQGSKNVCIFASSTGANFAHQLSQKIPIYKYPNLVLINPLLDVEFMFNKTIIPKQLKQYIKKINYIDDAVILVSSKDDVIDNDYYITSSRGSYIRNNNFIFTCGESTHTFEKLNKFILHIDQAIGLIE